MPFEEAKMPEFSYEKEILQVKPEGSSSAELDSFVPNCLWRPVGNRGAFGGQLFSHAMHAMMQTIHNKMHICSLHSHYLQSARLEEPISYKVERERDGVTYASRSVKAIQNGKTVFAAFALLKTNNNHLLYYPFKNKRIFCK